MLLTSWDHNMAIKRLLTEFGMGSSLRRCDYTEAAVRAVKDALWHNSINIAELFGKEKTEMLVDVQIGVQKPKSINVSTVSKIFPYGKVSVRIIHGGLDIPRAKGNPTVIANAAISVALDLGIPQ